MLTCRFYRAWMVLAVVLAGCEDRPAASSRSTITVVATVYPLADAARQIGSSLVDVTWIVEGGQAISSVDSNSEIRNRLRTADLVVAGGITEPWAILGFDDPMQTRLLRLDQLSSVHEPLPGGLLWLDPVVMAQASQEIGARLSAIRPTYERAFKERAEQYSKQIADLFQNYQLRFANAHTRNVLVINDEVEPLLRRIGLRSIVAVHSSPMNVSDEEVRILRNLARENKTQLLLIRSDTPLATRRDLEDRTRLQLVLIDVLGSSAAGGRNTYLDMLRYDLDELAKATLLD